MRRPADESLISIATASCPRVIPCRSQMISYALSTVLLSIYLAPLPVAGMAEMVTEPSGDGDAVVA